MYSYDFVFYKPGKKFYTQEEITRLKHYLSDAGFEVEGEWTTDKKEKEKIIHVDFDLIKSGQEFSLLLGPAEERFHGALGQLSIPEEQFEEDPEKSAELMTGAANRIFIGLDALFAWGDHEIELGRLEPFLRFDKIAALAWVNFLSRELVEQLGGIDKVLLFPDRKEKKLYEGKVWRFTPLFITHLPDDPTPDQIILECQRRWPGVVLRMGSYPPDSREAKMLEKMKLKLYKKMKIWEKQG